MKEKKIRVKVTDKIFLKDEMIFDSMEDCCAHFGKSNSWLTQQFYRAGKNEIEYAGYIIEKLKPWET